MLKPGPKNIFIKPPIKIHLRTKDTCKYIYKLTPF